ncbi:hypothetical protein [Aureivirga marina]|uniref:hypothetical protein n=1 Tax=Aureivirga marina TaxID=1182451 RepID=UPI0018C9F0F2|nr:hypothetical protein [Aureivirga marina]
MPVGFGQGLSMVKSVQQNRNLVKKRKTAKENAEIYKLKETKNFSYNEFSKEEMEDFKEKLQNQKKKTQIKNILWISLGILVLTLFIYLLNN